MTQPDMQYVIFVDDGNDNSTMFAAQVPEKDREFVRDHILTHLRPLSDEEYMTGPAIILHTFAKFSYILVGDDLLWCAEWQPGLIVVRFSSTGEGKMAWTALRSPNPAFGGRDPLPEDIKRYDEDAENHQYNLVFDPWDAQFDEQDRQWRSFAPATDEIQVRYDAALEHVNHLGELMKSRFSETIDDWAQSCQNNLAAWAGEGIRTN